MFDAACVIGVVLGLAMCAFVFITAAYREKPSGRDKHQAADGVPPGGWFQHPELLSEHLRQRGYTVFEPTKMDKSYRTDVAIFRIKGGSILVEGRATAGLPDIWIRFADGSMLMVNRDGLEPMDDDARDIMNRSLERWPS